MNVWEKKSRYKEKRRMNDNKLPEIMNDGTIK